ncbi:MAG: DNA repair ATPase, partial [Candidatus Eremiobacteraeota bacterium]|nr:DNA repair ATPase [Candidatus Eremiobacteraeota bacterium]
MAEAPVATPEGNQEIEHGAYEILKARLLEQARQLKERTDALNQKRADIFRSEELRIIGNERIRTEHACTPADIVAVQDNLLFGYNVHMTMKTAVPRDVFSLHRFEQREDGFDFPPLPQGDPADFLAQPEFVKVFDDMVRYYKGVRLRMLRYYESILLAEFQTGETRQDRRTLVWLLNREGKLEFKDDKGSINYPPSHSFDWVETTRDDHIQGAHPHVNIANKVFVECVGGDLTVKIEDNTEDGLGVYREEVEHGKQALHDAAILYYDADELILLRILPYREQTWRHLVYNTRDKTVHRIDAIGKSCIMLPNNHGIVFPGGYYLLEGTLRKFDGEFDELVLERPPVVSPNGEDVLYVFRNPESGEMVLLAYNLVGREMSTPIRCHGFSTFDDGKLVVFRSEPNAEAAKVHPMQIWQTPFVSREIYEMAPRSGVYLEKIGNTELVNGVSDCFSICRRIQEQAPSTVTYLDLINQVNRSIDSYHWLDHQEVGNIHEVLLEVRKTAELVLTEFDKVQTLKKQATRAVAEATDQLNALVKKLRPDDWKTLDEYVTALDGLRTQRGHLISLREMRYADQAKLEQLEQTALEKFDTISAATVDYLLTDEAFRPYLEQIEAAAERIDTIEKANEVAPLKEELEHIGKGLELLSEVVGSLKVDDATLRTRILENISEVLSNLNRSRALVEARRRKLGESESVAEFSVGFKLFSQNVSSTLNLADTPEKCDESLSALML